MRSTHNEERNKTATAAHLGLTFVCLVRSWGGSSDSEERQEVTRAKSPERYTHSESSDNLGEAGRVVGKMMAVSFTPVVLWVRMMAVSLTPVVLWVR